MHSGTHGGRMSLMLHEDLDGMGGTNVSCQLKLCPFVSCQLNFRLFLS